MRTRIENWRLTRRAIGVAFMLLAAWGWAGTARADWPMDPTPQELGLLPPYCKHVQFGYGATPEGTAHWTAVYGSLFHALHHYCYAFIYLMRADRHSTPAYVVNHDLSNAFAEIQYVIERSPPDHVLLPEMLTKQGMIKRRQGKPQDGMELSKKAIELDPRFPRAIHA